MSICIPCKHHASLIYRFRRAPIRYCSFAGSPSLELSRLTWSSTERSAALCPSPLSAALCNVWAGAVEPVVLGVAALLCNPANSPELQRKQNPSLLQFPANSSSEVTKQEFFKYLVNLEKAVGNIFNSYLRNHRTKYLTPISASNFRHITK